MRLKKKYIWRGLIMLIITILLAIVFFKYEPDFMGYIIMALVFIVELNEVYK